MANDLMVLKPPVDMCLECDGTGECPDCGGMGQFTNFEYGIEEDCGDCDGTGVCPECDGTGYEGEE